MQVKDVTIFICDHCKKKLFRKHAMVKHEETCIKNPQNLKACFNGCVHLRTKEVEIHIGYSYDGDPDTKTSGCFNCVKLKKLMYSFKAEQRGLPEAYPDDFEGQEKMPHECRHFTAYDGSKYDGGTFDLPF